MTAARWQNGVPMVLGTDVICREETVQRGGLTGIAWIFFAFLRISTKKGVPLQMKRAMGVVVPSLDCIFHLPMTNENPSTAQNETFTWLQPGAWRKPCIVHVTMVANSRQAEAKHYAYVGIPVESQRYRFVALNEMGRMLVAQ